MLNPDIKNINIYDDGHISNGVADVGITNVKYLRGVFNPSEVKDYKGPSYGNPLDYHSYIALGTYCSS